jgi:hypothetical protein
VTVLWDAARARDLSVTARRGGKAAEAPNTGCPVSAATGGATLADGATVLMPLDAYDFSPKFGWLQDRFGVSWQLRLPLV